MLQNESTTSLLNNQWSSRFIHFVVYNWLPNQMSGDEWNQTCSMLGDLLVDMRMSQFMFISARIQWDADKEFKRCIGKRCNRGLVLDNCCKYDFLEKYEKELRKMSSE